MLTIEQQKQFNFEFRKLAIGLTILRVKIPMFEFLDSRLIKIGDDTFNKINHNNNQKLKELIETDKEFLEELAESLLEVYKNDLGFTNVENYLIRRNPSEIWEFSYFHQIITLIMEAEDFIKTSDIKSLSGNYIYIYQKCFFDKFKYPEEYGDSY